LPRAFKAFLAIALLLAAQYIAYIAKRRHSENVGACEGASMFWFLAVGSSLAVISQTFQMGGEVNDFLRAWCAVSLPIVYLFGSRGAAAGTFVIIAFLISSALSWYYDELSLVDLVLLALWLPFYVRQLMRHKEAMGTVFLNFVFINGALVVYMSLEGLGFGDGVVSFALFCSIFWLLGVLLYGEDERFFKRVFEILAKVGIVAALIVLCGMFEDYQVERMFDEAGLLTYPALAVYAALLTLFCIYRRGRFWELLLPLSPLLIWVAHAVELTPMLNLFVVIGALAMIVGAFRKSDLALANQGLFLIAALACVHFFDSDLGFLIKGAALIAAGAALLALNIIMRRRLGGQK
jgi:hypothetical protein